MKIEIDPFMVSASGLEVRRFSLELFQEARGSILPIEHQDEWLPFRPVRSFLIFDVPDGEGRADHALLNCHELLVAVNGSMKVLLDNGTDVRTLTLDHPGAALYVPPMIWLSITEFSHAAVLYVLASEPYATTLRLRDHAEFQRQAVRRGAA